jgi:hypothetical protein
VLTTTVEFKVNKLLDYKTHAQKFVLTIFIMSSSQALVSGIFFYLDTIYTSNTLPEFNLELFIHCGVELAR